MKKQPVVPHEREAAARCRDFDEVISVYTPHQAREEASRCLGCKNPPCEKGCPVGIKIKEFIQYIRCDDPASAYRSIRQTNNFPSICGRVCPAEFQCRKACVLNSRNDFFASEESINIQYLERFAGDYGIESNNKVISGRKLFDRGVSAAVVGSGPAGLCCAGELARTGVRTTVYESLHREGGVLRYGIPSFRLPPEIIDSEIRSLVLLGVQFKTNYVIGRTLTLAYLREMYDAVFLGVGAGTPSFLKIPGENLCNIYSANEFLTRVNLMKAHRFPEYHTPVNTGRHVIVIGGGNTAMDAARVAIRIQHREGIRPDVTVLYRRTEQEMPARRPEILHAKEEGVIFSFLKQPTAFKGTEKGAVAAVRCLDCELKDPGADGRRKPAPLKGSEHDIPCDCAIIATGLAPNRLLTGVTPKLKLDEHGNIKVNSRTMSTSLGGVYAGGDIVGGEGTVIEAMGMAKTAASSIIKHLHFQRRK